MKPTYVPVTERSCTGLKVLHFSKGLIQAIIRAKNFH